MTETVVTSRLISGTGMLKIPPSEEPVRYYSVLVDVIRQPTDANRSFKYSPYRQRFATMVLLRGGYVVAEEPIDYARRRFDYLVNEAGQVLIAVKCAHIQVLSKLVALGATSSTSAIEEFANLNLMWDEARFVCHSDTALQVRLVQSLYSTCADDYREDSPPEPTAPAPQVPEGTPIGDISPPYEDEPTPAITQPYLGDESPDPDPVPTGTVKVLKFTYQIAPYPGDNISTVGFWEPVIDVYQESGKIKVKSFGNTGMHSAPLATVETYTVAPPDPFSVGTWSYEVV